MGCWGRSGRGVRTGGGERAEGGATAASWEPAAPLGTLSLWGQSGFLGLLIPKVLLIVLITAKNLVCSSVIH